MASKKEIQANREELPSTVSAQPAEYERNSSGVREMKKGRRSLRDAVLLLAKKMEEELGLDVSDVTEMLGVCTISEPPKPEWPDSDVFERETADLGRPLPRTGRDRSDR